MTKLKKRWILFFEDFTTFVSILIFLLQLHESSLASTTTRTPIQPPPQNYEGQAPWQRRLSPQQPVYQEPKNVGNTNQDIPWEQEQLLPMQGYQSHNQSRNQGKPPRSFMKFYPDALEKRPPSNQDQSQGIQPVNSKLEVEAIRQEMFNKALSLQEAKQDNTDRKSQTLRGGNSQRKQTVWRSERRDPATATPYWNDRIYEGPYRGQGRPYRRDPRPYPEERYSRNQFRSPTYPPPTYPPQNNRGGRWEQVQGTSPGPRGWDRREPYKKQLGGYNYPDHRGSQGSGGRGRNGAGSGLGSGHLMMVDPDLPDPLDDHYQRMQTHKAWEMMNGGSGHGLGLSPFVPPRRWGDRGVIPGGPTTPPWPNMDKRKRQNTGRAKIWAEEGSGFVGRGSGRGQIWNDQWSSQPNGTQQLNVTVNNPRNITSNSTPPMNEFQGNIGRPQQTRGTIPLPPPTDLLKNNPFQQQSPKHPRDEWNNRMQQLAAWERQQHTRGRPFPYEHPDSLQEAKRERDEERSRGQTTWPYQGKTNLRTMAGSDVGRSGVSISGRPPLKLSDLSPSLATILGNMTQNPQTEWVAHPHSPAMTHTFPPNQENPDRRNRFTEIPDHVIPRQGEQLQPPNIPIQPYTDTGGHRAFIGRSNKTKGDNQTDPDGPARGEVWQTPEGQQLSHDGSLLGPILARAKMRGFDTDHEQESELESEDSQLRKIIIGTYMEKLAIKDGEGGSGYDPFQAAMADINSTLWSTLRNISHNRDRGDVGLMGSHNISPVKSATAWIPTGRKRIGDRSQQSRTTHGQRQDGGFQRRLLPINPESGIIPHMDTVLQTPTRMPTVTGRGLNPMLVRGGNSGTPRVGHNEQSPQWPQYNKGPVSPSPRPAYNPHNPLNVFVPQDVYPQTHNPQVYDPRQMYNVQSQVKVTEASPRTPLPDTNDQNQNNDQNDIEELLPVGTKILPKHIPKILAILNVTVPNTTPLVLVASQMDGVQPGNNNEPARMVNIPQPTEEIQTATEFLQLSTARTIATESTSSAFGIIIACLVACAVVVGPGICIGCRMRQRSKQRERKKAAAAATRNEESGIMEAIIMSELGRSALNREDSEINGARPKSRSECGTFQELQSLRSGRESPTIIVH